MSEIQIEEQQKAEQRKTETKGLADCTLEEVFERLEQVIVDMEEEASLEKSFQMYHQGMELLKTCNEKIDRVEKRIQILDEEGRTHDF